MQRGASFRPRRRCGSPAPTARNFLQGLITNDIDKAKPGGAIHAGLLTPQGKILFDFFVVPAGRRLPARNGQG